MENDLLNKIYVLTGATSGIGLAAAHLLAERGAFLIGTGRSPERCSQLEIELRAKYPQTRVEYCVADLSVQEQVRHLAADIRDRLAKHKLSAIDGLINNAGTFTYWMSLTPEGFETQWAVNHLAPFLLTHELLPLLRSAPAGRVVTVSSGSHYNTRLNWNDIQLRRGYNCLRAYKQTKLANVLFTAEFNRRIGKQSILHAYAADPGLVFTEMGFKGNPRLARWIWGLRRRGGVPPEESARGILFLATEPSIQSSAEVYWKDCHPKAPNRYGLDKDEGWRLWNLSEQMCGIEPGKYFE
jgi:retinol dehydrogenase 12